MLMDVVAIQKLLPHRYPFLMVDGIVELEPLKRIVGIKNVSINESYFQGHFPGKPVMPGVLIIEAMAQTGGLLCLLEIPDRDKKVLYLVAMDDARFRRPVLPGDHLRLEVNLVFWRRDFCKIEGKATVDGHLCAEATLMCRMVDREAPAEAESSAAESAKVSQ
ncbi:MAG: 3-hydroxyacyl-ACP dehydratase FabZ [Candidatus Acidiferrum sp.]|jgi:beta-hydroxyacyl-ACP dehydratase FabZ